MSHRALIAPAKSNYNRDGERGRAHGDEQPGYYHHRRWIHLHHRHVAGCVAVEANRVNFGLASAPMERDADVWRTGTGAVYPGVSQSGARRPRR
jgi:hypothetical protein